MKKDIHTSTPGKGVNILLWILQFLLAFWNITGGAYMISNYSELASTWALDIFPHLFWVIFGGVQIVLAFGLVLPGIMKRYYKLTFISAIGLSLISLSGIALYAAYIGVGILWAIIPAILAGFVAYGRGCKYET